MREMSKPGYKYGLCSALLLLGSKEGDNPFRQPHFCTHTEHRNSGKMCYSSMCAGDPVSCLESGRKIWSDLQRRGCTLKGLSSRHGAASVSRDMVACGRTFRRSVSLS